MEKVKQEIMDVVRSYIHTHGGGSIEGCFFHYKGHNFYVKIEGK